MKFNIAIIGAGEVGFNLAKSLSKEDHDITVIDIDPAKCQKITNHIDARVIEGDGCSQRILQNIDMNLYRDHVHCILSDIFLDRIRPHNNCLR